MTTTAAKSAFGTTLTKGGQAIAELTNIGGPSLSADTIDVSSHDSDDGYREFVQGLRDGGEISLEGNFIPGNAGQAALVTDLNDGSLDEYVITIPAAVTTTWTFDAIITAFECSAPFDDKASFTATMKVSGKPTLGVDASAGMSALTGKDSAAGDLVFVPDFAIGTFFYTCDVANGITYVFVVPTATDHTITVNGSIVISEAESGHIALGDGGTNTEITIKVWEASKTAKTYTIWVTRAAV